MRINTNKVMVPDDILPQDGVWMWPEPGTWTGEDVFKLLDWMVSFNGIEYLAMNSQQPASICINNKIQSLTHPIPLLEDCHTIVQALGGPDLRVNHNNFYEESWRAASRSGNTYRGTVYVCSNSHDGIKGIEIFFTCRPQHTLWMEADIHPKLRAQIDQTNNGMIVVAGGTQQGKTTFLHSLTHHWVEMGRRIHLWDRLNEFDFDGHLDMMVRKLPIHLMPMSSREQRCHVFAETMTAEEFERAMQASKASLSLVGLHAENVPHALTRPLHNRGSDHHHEMAMQYFSATQLVIATRLVPSVNNTRVAVREWLPITPIVRQQLLDMSANGMTPFDMRPHIARLMAEHGCSAADDAARLHEQGKISDLMLKSIEKYTHSQIHPRSP